MFKKFAWYTGEGDRPIVWCSGSIIIFVDRDCMCFQPAWRGSSGIYWCL